MLVCMGLAAALCAVVWLALPRSVRSPSEQRRRWMREHREKRGPAPGRPRRIVAPSYGFGPVWRAKWSAAKKKARASAIYKKADAMPEPPREGM
ncbi:MAG: hypothetical protein AAFP18_05135 [Bacteroidota bacterium]